MDPGELDAAIPDDACFPGDLGYESGGLLRIRTSVRGEREI